MPRIVTEPTVSSRGLVTPFALVAGSRTRFCAIRPGPDDRLRRISGTGPLRACELEVSLRGGACDSAGDHFGGRDSVTHQDDQEVAVLRLVPHLATWAIQERSDLLRQAEQLQQWCYGHAVGHADPQHRHRELT